MPHTRDGEEKGITHRICYSILRLGEFICAVIVLAILARFCYLISIDQVSADGRIVYALVIASITVAYTIVLCLPINALAMSFPFDLFLFIAWLVAFSLLAAKSPSCSTNWYTGYWGFYWRRRGNGRGCGYWRTVLAFSFMASMAHLLSFILGIYIFRTYVRVKETVARAKKHAEKLRKPSTHANGVNGAGTAQVKPQSARTGTGTPPPMEQRPVEPVHQV